MVDSRTGFLIESFATLVAGTARESDFKTDIESLLVTGTGTGTSEILPDP